MAAKSILLKVTPEVHAQIQEAAGRHGRSMQNVLVALIERWLDEGGPDPKVFDLGQPHSAPGEGVDREARRAIKRLVDIVYGLQASRHQQPSDRDSDGPGWAERVLTRLTSAPNRGGATQDRDRNAAEPDQLEESRYYEDPVPYVVPSTSDSKELRPDRCLPDQRPREGG